MKYLMILILILGMLASSGCARYVYVHPRYPILPKPERPQLDNNHKENTKKLMKYARQLETAVDEYNKYAEEKNKESKLYE